MSLKIIILHFIVSTINFLRSRFQVINYFIYLFLHPTKVMIIVDYFKKLILSFIGLDLLMILFINMLFLILIMSIAKYFMPPIIIILILNLSNFVQFITVDFYLFFILIHLFFVINQNMILTLLIYQFWTNFQKLTKISLTLTIVLIIMMLLLGII